MSVPATHLFTPLRQRGLELRNRIVVSPMCEYSSQDGFANDWHLVHLGSRAVGGAGLVFTEATAVTPEGRISPEDLGIWKDEHIDKLRRITNFLRSQGAVCGMQLAHAGRKAATAAPWKGGKPLSAAEGGWPVVGPSPVAFAEGYPAPHELTVVEIAAVVSAFTAAARRALTAGFQVLEIHAAHGYLIHEFLSPLSNQRRDNYGGSRDNRLRLLCEVIEAVRGIWPWESPLWVRISATDWVEGGWSGEDSVALARRIAPLGVDMLDCSSAGNVPRAPIPVGPGYQTPLAARIRAEAGTPTAAVGMITAPAQADHIIRTGQADAVVLARELLRRPYWPLHAARALGHDLDWPLQYQRARD
ncbi:MAG TPA: NADH:flavin oxidoreductase/NADH oxidase [Terriglobales bacterium]|nr:NADH:flavin oxidoreductase/NADH oxidase [Terriglobales bacterium]